MSGAVLISVNAKYIHTPLAVLSLAANCDLPLRLFDFNINQKEDFMYAKILAAKPDVAAFSCYVWNIGTVQRLVSSLKKVLTDTFFVLGGPEVSYDAERYIAEKTAVVRGEGERVFNEVITQSQNGKGMLFDGVKGVSYYADGVARHNEPAMPPSLDALKFPYLNYRFQNGKIVYYESSRGCPFACAFCMQSATETYHTKEPQTAVQYVRYLPLPRVFDELSFFIDNKVSLLKFTDRTFNSNAERAFEIWRFIIENDNGSICTHFEIAADLITEQQIDLLKRARPGLIRLEAGVQSTNSDTLERVNRSSDTKKLIANINKINKNENVYTHLSLIAGLPGDDYASFKETFNEALSTNANMVQVGFLKILRGTMLYKHRNDTGLTFRDTPPYEILQTTELTAEELCRLKNIENVVDIFWNSGKFKETISCFYKCFETPFDFYEALALFRGDNYNSDNACSYIVLCEQLLSFAKDFFCERDITNALMNDMKSNNIEPPRAFLYSSGIETTPDVKRILRLLDRHYPDKIKCYLNYTTAYELLFAAILSAQSTDERVNAVTETLFLKYRSLESFAAAETAELEEAIKSIGLFRSKAANIKKTAKTIIERFGGEIPRDINDLVTLPGVGRKTANVIRGHIFGIPCVIVDTHVARVSRRLGLTAESDPMKIELDLSRLLPKRHQIRFNTQIIAHGRAVCTARCPKCDKCILFDHCVNKIT